MGIVIMEALSFFPEGTGTPKSMGVPNTIGLVRVPNLAVVSSDDVLIRVQYAGLCGTDIHIVQVNDYVL